MGLLQLALVPPPSDVQFLKYCEVFPTVLDLVVLNQRLSQNITFDPPIPIIVWYLSLVMCKGPSVNSPLSPLSIWRMSLSVADGPSLADGLSTADGSSSTNF